MPVHKIANEKTHRGSGKRVRGGMSSAAKPRDAHGRCRAVCENWNDFRMRILARENSRQCPGLDRMTRWKSVAALEKSNTLSLDLRPRPLRRGFEHVDGDLRINQRFNADPACISRSWIVSRLADNIERGPGR